MRHRPAPGCGPPWRAHDAPGPPRGHAGNWRRRRGFFRRMALAAFVVLTLCVSGAAALLWLAARRLGLEPTSGGAGTAILVAGGVAGTGAVALAVRGAMRRFALPLERVMEAADRVAEGDYEVRVAEHGPPAIRALARAFNTMTGRLRDHDRLRRDLMADIAHELRTPLTVIQGRLEGFLDGVYSRDDRQLEQLLEETHVLSRLVEDLRTLALSESGALRLEREPTDVADLAREVGGAFSGEARSRGVRVEVEADAELAPIDVDPLRIREVLGNLVSNALRHTPVGGLVTLRVGAAVGGGVVIEVRDTGSGMASEELAHAFDRFYRGPRSRGSGLGLSIARGLVSAHGGEIRAASEPGQGTTIAFTVPRRG